MVGQTTKGLSAHDIAVSELNKLHHFRSKKPALTHFASSSDNRTDKLLQMSIAWRNDKPFTLAVSQCFGYIFLIPCEEIEQYTASCFFNNISAVKEKCGDRAVLRAIHFFAEDERAAAEKAALQNGDFKEFLRLINESGDSSYKYLQNTYSVSAVNEQGLCLRLALTERFLKGRGACRVHGGGFAGTIQCFIPNDLIDDYKAMIEKVFGKDTCYILNIRPVGGYEITL